MSDATRLLQDLTSGDSSAAEELLPLVYDQLRALASAYFASQPRDHTLQPTALVHEAFLKMVRSADAHYTDKAHFCAVAARAMRQVLVNHAAARAAQKRGGERRRVQFDEELTIDSHGDSLGELILLDEALDRLTANDRRRSQVVEMRYFGGLTMQQIAHVLGVSLSTVESDWRLARAWLSRELSAGEESQS